MTPFLTAAAEAIRAEPLADKILLAPSYRVGRQWQDRLAEHLGGVVNLRVAPLKRLLLDWAEPVLRARGQRLPTAEEKLRLMALALAAVRTGRGDDGYFTRLPPSHPLTTAMLHAVEEVEAAGAESFHRALATRDKADELAALWQRYRADKRARRLAGPDAVGDAAALALRRHGGPLPLLLIPASLWEDADRPGRTFVQTWADDRKRILPEAESPPTASLEFLVADCVADEARAVFRRVQAHGIPLDRVEVICTDPDGYAPALCAAALEAFGGRVEDLPVTFNAGLPGMYARPVRLLAAWLEWVEADLPPAGLADMVEGGLLGDAWRRDAPRLSASRLASRLRALPINGGPGDYRAALGHSRDGGDGAAGETWLARTLPAILPLATGGDALDRADARAVLNAAAALLRLGEDRDGKLDAYARVALREAVAAWLPHCDWPGFDAVAWLTDLAAGLKVMGLGPMPGRLHVTDIPGGGHGGREHTFILGLDDARFPGGARQDPVLLDKERSGISRHLPVSRRRRDRREQAMRRLLARLGGTVRLCRSTRDGGRGRDLYPAALFADLADRAPDKPATAVLRPDRPAACLTRRDDWLHAALPPAPRLPGEPGVGRWYPHLAEGARAAAARRAAPFSPWDGRAPAAGEDYERDGWVLSPTDLELLAACPLEFFFKKVLGVKRPDRYEPTPGRWLEGNERGTLLHEVFQTFVDETKDAPFDEAALPGLEAHLVDLLDRAVRRERRRKPPRDDLAYQRDWAELTDAGVIFLMTEIGRRRSMRPLCLEAALGGAKVEAPPWFRAEPVALTLPGGGLLRLKGRIDRIDRLHDGGGLRLWDYKTTSSAKFPPDDPFRAGRHLQPLLYTAMAEQAAAEAGRPEPVRAFSYFFPMPRDEGREIAYERERLAGGMTIVETLHDLLRRGLFPFTTDRKDVAFSDYRPVYGDAAALADAARRKAQHDPALEAWAALRGLGGEEHSEEE